MTTKRENLAAILKLFTFEKKRELEKYCREVVIYQSEFVDVILACESGTLPLLHQIFHRQIVPEDIGPTDQDLAALTANGLGLLKPDARKAVNKLGQLFRVRRQLVGHIFYAPGTSEWHFFQFDQRDLDAEGPNHWKGGTHMHFLNWLWPNYDRNTLWADFTSGRAKMNDSLHVRYVDAARADPGE
ncbi:MAG: hypothetical protein ABSF97_01045 [Candidatus Sulfotelmatobacter sp.]|jgi:hypothetical protein